MLDSFLNSQNCPVQAVWATLHESELRNLQTSPTLRTYVTYIYKTEFCFEPYVYNIVK